jgi:hypothetical protein
MKNAIVKYNVKDVVRKEDYDSLVKQREEIKRVLASGHITYNYVKRLDAKLAQIRSLLKDAHREQYRTNIL